MFDDTLVVYASADHRLARRKRLTIANIAQERWALPESNTVLHQRLRRMFEEEGFAPPTIAMETVAIGPRFQVVASTDVLGFTVRRLLQEVAARLHLVELNVKGLPWIRAVGVSYRKDAYLSPTARRFIEILKTKAKEITAVNR